MLPVAGAAYNNYFNGTFVCKVKMNGDGNQNDQVLEISGSNLKSKPLGKDDTWFSVFISIQTGGKYPQNICAESNYGKIRLYRYSLNIRKEYFSF